MGDLASRQRPLPPQPIATLAAASVMAFAIACSQPPAQPPAPAELTTEDVAAAPDASADLSGDGVPRPSSRPAAGLAGVLPSDFPTGVPLPIGGSVVDFGSGDAGSHVVLRYREPSRDLVAELRRRLTAAGYRLTEAGEEITAERGSEHLRFTVASVGSASELRVSYLPAS
jgi:hypothetical protein